MDSSTIPIDKKELKYEDLLQSSNVFSSEFNNSRFHDRVLVFRVDDEVGDEGKVSSLSSRNIFSLTRLWKVSEYSSIASEYGSDIEQDMKEEDIEEEDDVLSSYSDSHRQHSGEIKPDIKQLRDHKIFVHSCWLSVQSSFFKCLFYSGMKESHSKEVVMKIPQSELEAHVTLIEAMYKTDILNSKDYKLVVQVLVLADKYDVELVFKKCKYVLIDTPKTLESCQFILENINNLPNCDDLVGIQTKFLVKIFTCLDQTWTGIQFIGLSEVLLRLILGSDNLGVHSENTVFIALMKWMECNNISPSSSSLLSLVRFEFMTMDFLYDVVRHHNIAKQMLDFSLFLQQGLGYHGFSQERIGRLSLENKPVPRLSFHSSSRNPTFIWAIDKDLIRNLLSGDGITEVFWYKGYQMMIELGYDEEQPATFSIYLSVENIPSTGSLHLSWKVKSNLFKPPPASLGKNKIYGGAGGLSWGIFGVESGVSLAATSAMQIAYFSVEVWVKLI